MTPIKIDQNAATLETSPAFEPISRVTLIVGTDEDGDEVSYTAGDDTGRELTARCPWATQRIADNLLAEISGYAYQPYAATDALLDPAAELGDAVSVGGVTSVVYTMETTFDALYTVDISAPQDEEIDHEYPYEPQPERTAARKAATVTAELSVLADTISSKISSTDAQTLITQNLNSIKLEAVAGSNQSTVTISADGITVKSAIVSFSNIEADSIVANASITAPSIYGGTFYNADGDAYLTVGDDLNFYGSATTGAPLFTVFDDIGTMDLKAYNNTFLSYSSTVSRAFASGDWKFNGPILLTSGVHYGTLAQRPAAGTAGRIFFVRT